MKICFIAELASNHTRKWVKYFINNGHDIHVISLSPLKDGDIEGAHLHILKTLSFKLGIVVPVINILLSIVQVRKLLSEINPDLVHAHYITDNGLLGVMSGFHPLVLSAWGSDILIDPIRYPFLKMMNKIIIKKADLITADGENTIQEMIELGGDLKRMHLIYMGVDTQQFKPAAKNETLKKELGVSGNPVIISIRSLMPIYNVETVVKSVPLVLKQFPEAKFLIGGSGVQKNYLEDIARSLGVSKQIIFIGQIPHDELPNYLTLADIYVSSSLSDGGLSLSLAEAMSCGIAPVVTDVGDNNKWIKNGKNGFIVPIKSPDLFAEKIVYLLKNKCRSKEFGKINRGLVEEKASYEKEMEKVEKLYENLNGKK